MNRSNVQEIKKTLAIKVDDIPSIDTICTCFVNGNKEKLISNTEKYSSLEEEEQFKYIDILKGALTGAIGKKLINLEYTSDESSVDAEKKMAKAYKNMFSDDAVRDALFDQIIDNFSLDENYLIVVGHGIYDAPVKASDGAKLEDETDSYEFMVAAICPVHSTKAGLTLDSGSGRMVSSKQVQIVQAPVNGFLYPAFNDRQTDLHGLLFFTKKPEEDHPELMEALIGVKAPTSSVKQQNIFETIIADVTNGKADLEVVKAVQENLTEIVEQGQLIAEEKSLTKDDIKQVLVESGIDEEKLSDFDHIYERAGGEDDTDFKAQNLVTLDKFQLKTPDIEIKIKPDKRRLVRQERVRGKRCIVVELEDGNIELNGIQVSEG